MQICEYCDVEIYYKWEVVEATKESIIEQLKDESAPRTRKNFKRLPEETQQDMFNALVLTKRLKTIPSDVENEIIKHL